MPKLIKQIHDLFNIAIDKGVTEYIPNSKVDDIIDQGQMSFFRELLQKVPRTKRERNYLLPFEATQSITITSSVGTLDAAFEHEIEAYVTVSSVKYPVNFIERGFFRRRLLDKVDPPGTTNLFAVIYNDSVPKIEISNDITPVVLSYYRRPVKPVYATSVVDGYLQYNDASSTDVEWSHLVHDILIERTFQIAGLNMREMQVIQAGANVMPKSASI